MWYNYSRGIIVLIVRNSINLDFLYKSLIKDIKSVWTNPFEAPTIICSDIKVEQWLKLAWISGDEKDFILMNLKSARLESFVFEAVADGIQEKSKIWYERLDDSILKSGIIRKLISIVDESGRKYYETLESDSVKSFIENKNGSVNEIKLSNFANIMTKLFTEYLNTRNNDFNSGIYTKWISDNSYFNFENNESKAENVLLENWQRKLFKDLFSGDYFTIPYKNDGYTVKYVTLSQLIAQNKDLKFKFKTNNLFFFGFSGIGQEYREVLKKMANSSDSFNLYVYIQNSDQNFSELDNTLTKKWNKAGCENLLLWKESNLEQNRTINDGEDIKGSTFLKTLQNQILNDTSDTSVFTEKLKDGSFTVTSSPSKLKEIEDVHSSICSIINKKKQTNEAVSYSDFIVLAPNIQEYKVSLKQVFEQNERFKTNGFPYIPYVMSDYSADSSAVKEVLYVLSGMLEKKSLNRVDLFTLLRNSVVREVRKFEVSEIDSWANWVCELNGYRKRGCKVTEWVTVCRRLLLSRLSDTPVADESSNEIYIPYSNIDTENSDSLYKFIDAIESLEDFISEYSDKKELEESDIDKISVFLESWLKLPKKCSEELIGEHIVYAEVKSEINNQKLSFSFGNKKINAKCFFISLCESAKASKGSSTNLFTGGITFGNFALNRTIPAKYVYIIGLGSKVFPGMDLEQSLDLRTKVKAEPGDETTVSRNKEAFFCQLMATKEELHLSYVNKNLKKDEDLFRSSVIEDLYDYIKNPSQELAKFINDFELKTSIDEKRNWNELYTQREFRNKRNFLLLTNDENKEEVSEHRKIVTTPERVSFSQIKNFLQNPFIYQAKQLFEDSDDEDIENESLLYEPIKISDIDMSCLVKSIVHGYFESDLKDSPDVLVKAEIEKLKHESAIPDGIFGEVSEIDISGRVRGIINQIEYLRRELINTLSLSPNLPDYKFNESKSIFINQTINNENVSWMLSGTLSGYFWTKKNNQTILELVEIVPGNDIRPCKHMLNPYLSALMLILSREEDSSVAVDIHILNKEAKVKYEIDDVDNPFPRSDTSLPIVTKENALEILRNIYSQMFIEKYNKNVSIDLIKEDKINDPDFEFQSYKSFIENDFTWKYFSKNVLFNPYTDFGITSANFKADLENAYKVMKSLIKVKL